MDLSENTKRNTMLRMELGKKIQKARKDRGLSQPELSERCGWGYVQARISHYETGRREINLADALVIAKALELSLSELFEDVPIDPVGAPAEDEAEFLSNVSALSEDEILSVLEESQVEFSNEGKLRLATAIFSSP